MNNIKFCSNCGCKLNNISNFCSECGFKLNQDVVSNLSKQHWINLMDEINYLIEKGGLLCLEFDKKIFKFSKEKSSYKLKLNLGDPDQFSELEKRKLDLLEFKNIDNSILKMYTLSYKEKFFEEIYSLITQFSDLSGDVKISYSDVIENELPKADPIPEIALEKDERGLSSELDTESFDDTKYTSNSINYDNPSLKKNEKILNLLLITFGIISLILLGTRFLSDEKEPEIPHFDQPEKTSNSEYSSSHLGPLVDQDSNKKEESIANQKTEEVQQEPQESKPNNGLESNPFKGKAFTFKSVINDKEVNGVTIQTNNETSYHIFDFQKNMIHLIADFQGEKVQFSFPVSGYYLEKGLTDETHVFVIGTLGVQEIYLSLTNGNLGYDYDDGSRINHFVIKQLK